VLVAPRLMGELFVRLDGKTFRTRIRATIVLAAT
jgi:hypothetical protein